MSANIYLIKNNDELLEMPERSYDSEELLQNLLAKYPNLLAGEQIDRKSPRRWLFIKKEIGVPFEKGSGNRWSLDHLFVDQDAIPTLIEVKRSSDTRIRREVVGQMLEYAANAVSYWPVEKIREHFEEKCSNENADPQQKIMEFVGTAEKQDTVERFWQNVESNLQNGKVRMLFVSDRIPAELQRIVEFLNEQMSPAEILAVEIRQYVTHGHKTLVPSVVGQTSIANQKKSRATHTWDETSFFYELERRVGKVEVSIARRIFEWANDQMPQHWWGSGIKTGSYYPILEHSEMQYQLICLSTNGNVAIQFGTLRNKPPFDDERKRLELLKKLNEIPNLTIDGNAIAKGYPSFRLSILKEENILEQFLDILKWALQEIKAT